MSQDLDWQDHASCRGQDPNLWFPERSEKAKRAEAKRICRSCPVIAQCKQFVADNGPFFGIWAGKQQNSTTARKRYSSPLANLTGLRPCGTPAAYRRHTRHGEKPCDACLDAHYRATGRREANA